MAYLPNTSHLMVYQRLDGVELEFNLSLQHTIIKKFDLIFKQVNTILEMDTDFHILYDEFMTIMHNTDDLDFARIQIILPQLITQIDKYAEQLDYWKFSYTAPRKISEYKLHIDKNGYLEIMKASVRCKFVCVPVTTLREEHMSIVRYIYNIICKEMIESDTQFKLERIIDSIVLSTASKGLDNKSNLWMFFGSSKGLDPQNLALRERNSIFYKGLPTIATGLDCVKWFVALSKTSISFQMKDKINEINIAYDSPIESVYENSADMLKVFLYEEVTSNRKLMKLLKEFPFAIKMAKEYVYPITNWITAPFISKVFHISNLNISHLINIMLLNIFAYKFLRNEEKEWQLFDLLTYRTAIKSEKELNSNKYQLLNPISKYNNSMVITSKTITTMIKTNIQNLKFIEDTIYTSEQLEELFRIAIKTLLSYDYYDHNNIKIPINPIAITNEYTQYIYNMLVGKYEDIIEEARKYFKGEV